MNANALAASVRDVLEQGLQLLRETDSETYKTVAPAPHAASIGQHYRHVLDHFLCLAEGMVSGTVNYDERSRDRALETDRNAAQKKTEQLITVFSGLREKELKERYNVLYSVGYSNDEALVIETFLARELAFCVSHAIHHFAIIRLVCSSFNLQLPIEFGVAPSTLKYRAAQAGA